MKRLFILFGFISMSQYLVSQVPGYNISFDQIFDNREYFSDYAFPQTIFGVRLNGSLCFEIDSIQGFAAGINYMYEHGSTITGVSPQLNLYYRYHTEHINLAFGSFPRINRINMPLSFLNDTLNYYRPNVEGAYMSYSEEWGRVSGFIDWTGRVSESSRETFLVGLNSKLDFHKLFLEPSFLMYHNAKSYSALDSIHLQDNGILSLVGGFTFQSDESSFSMIISSGIMASYNRFRPDDFLWGRGSISNIDLRYGIFGLKGVYYIGTPIQFEYGDPFYSSGNYGRLDIYFDPFKNPKVDSKIGWNLHYVPSEGIHHSQQLLISVKF